MPQLLIVRHAIAVDRDEARVRQWRDADRPLTDKGRRRMQQAAAGIRIETGPLHRILSSPFRRAQQTAEILAREYPDAHLAFIEGLSPGQSLSELIDALADTPRGSTLALVGHEPDLSQLIALLLCGDVRPAVRLKKGGAALIDFPLTIEACRGELLWLLTPGQLRKLGSESR